MQEEARFKQSFFEYRQKLTFALCLKGHLCGSMCGLQIPWGGHRGAGWELLCVRGGQPVLDGGPCSTTVHPSSRLPRARRRDC